MIYVSFVELFQQANTTLSAEWGAHTGVIVTVASFFAGILLIGVIDRLVPSIENPHEAHRVEEMDHQPHNPRLMRMGVMTALAIGHPQLPRRHRHLHFGGGQHGPRRSDRRGHRPSTTFPKASPSRSRSTTPRATAERLSACRSSRASPNPSEPYWHGWC